MASLTHPTPPPPPGLEGEPLLQELAHRYVAAMGDMEGRKPGPTSILGEWCWRVWGTQGVSGGVSCPRLPPGTSQLRPGEPQGYRIPFNPTGTGCGAAMRSLAIGLRWGQGQGKGRRGEAMGAWGAHGDGWVEASQLVGWGQDGGGERMGVGTGGLSVLEGQRRGGDGAMAVSEWGNGNMGFGERDREGTGRGTRVC